MASIGVAAVSYVACGGGDTVANLMAAPPDDAGTTDAPKDTKPPFNFDVVANLVPPPGD